MSGIKIEVVGQEELDRTRRLLAGIDGGMEKAVNRAMKRTTSLVRSNSTKEIRKRYDISAANLRTEKNIKIRYTYQNGIQANMLFSGNKIPLYRYNKTSPKTPVQDDSRWVRAKIDGQWRSVHPSLPAKAHLLKGTTPTVFKNAFVAEMDNGGNNHTGIFERDSNRSSKIHELMGLSIPQMMGSPSVIEAIAEDAAGVFHRRLDHEMKAILNGYGGAR